MTSTSFTTIYTYGNGEGENVFACRGRPFVALMSPTFTLIDYDLTKKLGLELTNVQCCPLRYGNHKTRILGQVSTAVQCVQEGEITDDFRIKALVVTDLYSLLDAHCVVGAKMKERIANLNQDTGTSDDEPDASFDGKVPSVAAQTLVKASTVTSSSSSPIGTRAHSPAPGNMMTSYPIPVDQRVNSSAPGAMMTGFPIPVDQMTSLSAPSGQVASSSAPGATMTSSPIPMDQRASSSAPGVMMTTGSFILKVRK